MDGRESETSNIQHGTLNIEMPKVSFGFQRFPSLGIRRVICYYWVHCAFLSAFFKPFSQEYGASTPWMPHRKALRLRPSLCLSMNESNEGKSKRKPNSAFMKPVQPDEKLAAVVGNDPLPRSELIKKLWAYIHKHGLQDQKKKTLINADDNLKAVFDGKSQVTMFEMTKLVSGHLRS